LYATYSGITDDSPEFDVSHMSSEQIDHYLNEQGIFDLEYWRNKQLSQDQT
jgi:hypothetical protein